MKKEGPSKTTKKGSSGGHRQRVRDLKQKRLKKKPRWNNRSAVKDNRYAIVRVIGHGQFKVDNRTAKKINKIDDNLIKIIQTHEQGEKDFARIVDEVLGLVKKVGLPLEHREIVESDIIVPGADISIEDAKNMMRGKGFMN
ncbi:MAG: hypothetical protein DLM72_14930 [Candidatus Nitrosopolaris wilkensis]|nr:MAG: hypothetical protein DLM72_14930 [Candidatus Nitrosopolaris wilkensis]